ncbi:MAG: helix-turn-helix transcriptional regulator [Spirochaetes bacterium]|nr:helix-turn-helix transcriptional regulator [Spirochaetota bacterium]
MSDVYRARDFFHESFPFYIRRVTHHPSERLLKEPRRREFWKFAYVLAGHASHQIGACRLTLRPGAVYLVHPEDQTAYLLRNEPLSIWHALFLPTMVFPELSALGEQAATYQAFSRNYAQEIEPGLRRVLVTHDQRPWPIRAQLQSLQAEFDGRALHWRLRVRHLLVALLIDVSRQAAAGVARMEVSEVGNFLRQYLAHHHAEPLTLTGLARAVGYAPSHTSRIFHAQSGRPLFEYLQRLRVQAACALLRSSDRPVRDIGMAVGFRDPSHFQRAFRRLTGASPLSWRRRALPPPDLMN